MMGVHTTNKCHLFNPLSTYSHFEAWILFVEQNHSQAMDWGFVAEMMLGPVWAKNKKSQYHLSVGELTQNIGSN